MLGRAKPDFSLSGLKTAVRLEAQRILAPSQTDIADLCASFQAAVVDTVIDRSRAGLRLFRETVGQSNAMVVAGGVGANGAIRRALMRFCGESGLRLVLPPPHLCTDNGAMIAWAGIERLSLGLVDDMTFAAKPRWPLDANAEAAHHGKA
jgi:N6-L-threonylcarbamoyladenine synthase